MVLGERIWLDEVVRVEPLRMGLVPLWESDEFASSLLLHEDTLRIRQSVGLCGHLIADFQPP